MQRVENVHVPAEEDADLRGAARRHRPHGRDARNNADRLFDGPGDPEHLDIHGRDAVVNQDDDARKIGLREDGDGETEEEGCPGERKTQDDDHHRPGVSLDDLRQAAGHGLLSSRMRIRAPEASPYAPSTMTGSPAVKPRVT